MARRDRTTGLPRPKARESSTRTKSLSDRLRDESTIRVAIIGGAALLLVFVLGLMGWRWYDSNYRVPEKVIIRVGETERFRLKYYADRLYPYIQSVAQTGTSVAIAEQQLLRILEDEGLVRIIAAERGITVSDEEVTAEIAAQLGVSVGGAGSSFDTLYRQRLETLAMSNDHYRRWVEAQVYIDKLTDALVADLGETTEMVTLRAVVSASQADAQAAKERVEAGEDLGTVAQTVSTNLVSRQKDGLFDPEPPLLLPRAIQDAIEGKEAGTELFGPIQVQDNWWVFRLETRDPDATPSGTQKTQLGNVLLEDTVTAKRSEVTIRRNINASDIRWAEQNAR
ncbi:MAG TPA: SurA N-terminal domain-containing protein [Tepidiformaceae bacterium]|nr:SurA N-terminal domain-containing protein [Tepidiformaceae bacterium]